MIKYRIIAMALFLTVLFVFSSCIPNDDDSDEKTFMVNTWISEAMENYYFWYQNIPTNKKPNGVTSPEDYFNSLLYTAEDKWSFIVDDYTGFMAGLEGNPLTMGYSPAFGLFSDTDNVFIIVEYVYKDSPAQRAGLKRGDIIIKIDGEALTKTNYFDKYNGESYTVTLGRYAPGVIYETTTKISLKAEVIDLNPVLCDSIYTIGTKKIGYIALSEFIDYEPFKAKVQPVLNRFKSRNITDLVVDLRYNGGGEQNAAIWLASAIAPYSYVSQPAPFIHLTYNDKLQDLMQNDNQVDFPFNDNPGINLNLQNVYFLTTGGTASASELVIVGLEAYMNVIQIGENTYGKYTGMWLIGDLVEPARHNWAILPIVMKYANSQGKTDFKDGLEPDYAVKDHLEIAQPLGSGNDPQLAQAMNVITGKKSGLVNDQKSSNIEYLSTPGKELKRNLIARP